MEQAKAIIEAFRVHRDRLLRLAESDDPVAPIVAEVGAQRGWWPAGQAWARINGRYHPWRVPYAVLVYESVQTPQRLCVVELCADRPTESNPSVALTHDPGLGWLRFRCFPDDPHLPTLPRVWSGDQAQHVVRYRPYWRCTIRADGPAGLRFVKVFRPGDGDVEQLHRITVELWEATQRGELDFAVAAPDRADTASAALWQCNVVGTPALAELYGAAGTAIAQRMGAACASIPAARLTPVARIDLDQQLQASVDYARIVRARLPELTEQLDAFVAALTDWHARAPRRELRPIHGSPHPTQWLSTADGLALVDFDRFSFGDPELDVATFAAELDFTRSTQLPVERLNQAFIDGYQSRHGPLEPVRMRLYRTHKRFAKVQRTACGLRPDAPERAAVHLRRAWEALRAD